MEQQSQSGLPQLVALLAASLAGGSSIDEAVRIGMVYCDIQAAALFSSLTPDRFP